MKSKVVVSLAIALVSLQVLLVFVSWLLSATMDTGVRSFLTSEGIRWFLGSFTTMLQSPLLVWILLLSMAYGVADRAFFSPQTQPDRRKLGIRLSVLFVLLYVLVILSLTVIPHAVLISVSGHLFPSSPFSRALVPILAFGSIVGAVVYGFTTRVFRYVRDITNALVYGLSEAAPVLFLYVLFMQFYASLRFVFDW